MSTPKDFDNGQTTAWCPGCGNFITLAALRTAFADLGLEPHQIVMVGDIGQAAKTPGYLRLNGFHGIHGRAVPIAQGVKLANHELTVIAMGGDGGSYGEGVGHLVAAARRNLGIVQIVENNQVYGLTKGQYSPTSDLGFKTPTSPEGTFEQPLNPIELALACGATFVARSSDVNRDHLVSTLKRALQHKGYALVDVLQPCVTFNRVNTYDWYRQRVYDMEAEGHVSSDLNAAMVKAREWGERIPIGVFFETRHPTYEGQVPALQKGPLVRQSLAEQPRADFEKLKEMLT
jgi:2-oxoglutarate/2-oxoacid ferredoxin oxidoreductase subunit beta